MCISGPIQLSASPRSLTPCPAGTRIKASILEDQKWLTAADLCASLTWTFGWMKPVCDQLLPQLVDIQAMCGTPAPTPPTIDLEAMALDGTLYRIPNTLLDWFVAWWKINNWNTYCECVPSLGPGPCPAVPATGASVTNKFDSPMVKLARIEVGHAWDTMNGTMRTTGPSADGGMRLQVVLVDAAGTNIHTTSETPVTVPGSQAVTWSFTTISATIRNNVRYVDLWGRNYTSTVQTRTATIEINSYTGPCTQTVLVTPPSPDPIAEPPKPDLPDLPAGPVACTTSDLCQIVYAFGLRLDQVVKMLQLDIDVDQHTDAIVSANLPIDEFPSVEIPLVPPDYQIGPTHGPLTGRSSMAVSGLVGLSVALGAGGEGPLELEGQPPYLWNRGWMSILNDDGMLAEKRVTREQYAWLEPAMRLANTFAWTLPDGVEMFATELLPL